MLRTLACILFLTVLVTAYHQGGSETMCWKNGVEVTPPSGLVVAFWPEPPLKWREDETIKTGWNCSADSAVKIDQGLSASDPDYFKHMNIHSCKTEVAFCDPAARGPLITSTPEIRGNGSHYSVDFKLPAGGYTIIAHVKFYNYSCAVGRFVEVSAAPVVKQNPTTVNVLDDELLAIIIACSGAALVVAILAGYYFYKKKKNIYQQQLFLIDWNELEFGKRIGAGAFGEVFKGEWRGTQVAIKKLLTEDFTEEIIEEFKMEAAVMFELRHPNIVLFMGACLDLDEDKVCIVAEFMPRGSLFDLLMNRDVVLDWPKRYAIALEAARGMQFLHASKILHHDFKSGNLLVDMKWNVKVADFGLSKYHDRSANDISDSMSIKAKKNVSHSNQGQESEKTIGSLFWSAPEVLRGADYTEAADVYSYAITLIELVTRDIPYRNIDSTTVALKVMDEGLRPSIPAYVPEDFAALIRDCWKEDPTQRPNFRIICDRLEGMKAPAHVNTGDGMDAATSGAPMSTDVCFLDMTIPNHPLYWDRVPSDFRVACQTLNELVFDVVKDMEGLPYLRHSDSINFQFAFDHVKDAVNFLTSVRSTLNQISWSDEFLQLSSNPETFPLAMALHRGPIDSILETATERIVYSGDAVDVTSELLTLVTPGDFFISGDALKNEESKVKNQLGVNDFHLNNIKLPSGKMVEVFSAMGMAESLELNNVPGAVDVEDSSSAVSSSSSAISKKSTPDWYIHTRDLTFDHRVAIGTFGELWQGQWKGETVGIKKPFKQMMQFTDLITFRFESTILLQLDHPNIMPVLGVGMHPPKLLLVEPFYANGSIDQYMRQTEVGKKMSMSKRMEFCLQLAKGMQYLHAKDLIHGAFKPTNVLVSDDGESVLISDVGFRDIRLDNQTMTACSKVSWTAPEVLSGATPTAKSDVYSLAMVCYEILTGNPIFSGLNSIAVALRVLSGSRPDIPKNISPGVSDILSRGWAAQINQRPTLNEYVQELVAAMDQ